MKVTLGVEPTTLDSVVEQRFASRLAARDSTLWGPAAEDEAAKRLAWIDLPRTSEGLLAPLETLRRQAADRGLDRVVLCGMGGSSLGPEVVCRAADRPLVVLDSSSPDQVRDALEEEPDKAVVVVSSKSGGTVETDSQRRAFEQAYRDLGRDPAYHLVIVTDPGSPLGEQSSSAGYAVVEADPEVGGRFSVLSAFGLVPSALAGADVAQLLADAQRAHTDIVQDDAANPALRLGLYLAEAVREGRDKLVLVDHTGWGLGDWIEQLVAESTGKDDTGILPVIVAGPESFEATGVIPDVLVVHLGDAEVNTPHTASVDGTLGEQFLLWEAATAVAGASLAINPFDQPDVESAKAAARTFLEGQSGSAEPDFVDGPTSVFLGPAFSTRADTAAGALTDLLALVGEDQFLAICAYLDRPAFPGFPAVRESLATRLARPVTFGWGPRFLHSTGQFHKGGPATGVFLQITSEPNADLAVAGRDFTFQDLLLAQASGDADVLGARGLPVLRLHLNNAANGVAYLRGLLS